MKLFPNKNKILSILLICGFALNLLWSAKLEVEASKVKSTFEDWRKTLNQDNIDDIKDLLSFGRWCGGGDALIHNSYMGLSHDSFGIIVPDVGVIRLDDRGLYLRSFSRIDLLAEEGIWLYTKKGDINLDAREGGSVFLQGKEIHLNKREPTQQRRRFFRNLE